MKNKLRLWIVIFVLLPVFAFGADFTITIPDAKAATIISGFVYQLGYQNQVKDANGNLIPNPESKVAFAKRKIREYIRVNYEAYNKTQRMKAEGEIAAEEAKGYTEDIEVN